MKNNTRNRVLFRVPYLIVYHRANIVEDWDMYIGAENLTDYTQPNPIIDAENPLGADFDASLIWGPVMGRNIYVGIRYNIK